MMTLACTGSTPEPGTPVSNATLSPLQIPNPSKCFTSPIETPACVCDFPRFPHPA